MNTNQWIIECRDVPLRNYANGSGVGQVVKRLEAQAAENQKVKAMLARVADALRRENV